MNKKLLIGLGCVALIALVVVLVQTANNKPEVPRKTEVTVTHNGSWSRYTTNDWEGFAFSYPSHWALSEKMHKDPSGKGALSTVEVTGDGYYLGFSMIPRPEDFGVENSIATEVVSGHEVTLVRTEGYTGFQIFMDCGGLLESPTESREIADKIVASLSCPDPEGFWEEAYRTI